MRVPEIVYPDVRLILLDQTTCPPNVALAHAIVHLDLHLDGSGDFTEEQVAQARFLTDVRLDQHYLWAG